MSKFKLIGAFLPHDQESNPDQINFYIISVDENSNGCRIYDDESGSFRGMEEVLRYISGKYPSNYVVRELRIRRLN